MYLKTIKLVGFKSFVDATTFPIRSHMNAIVGPNGCGKSNVVDALRWVIGESSAKQLRGQSMSDVIFNGTTTRKPVGKAAVELVFDNTDGKLGGEFAKYTELAVRREVTRDGISDYYLNGTSCRRKDIIDIFLGTGLGPRSYAIIEQGMVSRLIEAKPEDLRVYIEEAAGISKYKERRRETENRMRHTEENLERVNDVSEELNKQLNHLKRQANAAERYHLLKEEERLLSAQLRALQWRVHHKELEEQDKNLLAIETRQEECIAEQRQLETNTERARIDQTEAMDAQTEVQKRYYGLGAEIARLEQRIKSLQEQAQQWQQEYDETNAIWSEISENSEEYQLQITELESSLARLIPDQERIQQEKEESQQNLLHAEGVMNQWQDTWDNFQRECSQSSQQLEVNKTKIEYLKNQLSSQQQRKLQLKQRYESISMADLEHELSPLSLRVSELTHQIDEIKNALESSAHQISQQRTINASSNKELQTLREQLQSSKGRYASLDALQQAALGSSDAKAKDWLVQNELKDKPRLAQQLEVEAGWEAAVETVLGNYFDAICVDQVSEWANRLSGWQEGDLTLIEQNSQREPVSSGTLASKIKGQWVNVAGLDSIYVADNLETALNKRAQLKSHESIITPDGIWLAKNWMRISRSTSSDSGVLLREQELKQTQQQIQSLQESIRHQENLVREGEECLRTLETERDGKHKSYQEFMSSLNRTQSDLSSKQSRLTELTQQQQRLERELQESELQTEQLQAQLIDLEANWQQGTSTQDSQTKQRDEFLAQRNQYRTELEEARNLAQSHRQLADQLAIQLAANENQLALLKQTVTHNERRLTQLNDKRENLAKHLAERGSPLEELNKELQEQLTQHLAIEQELNAAQARLETCTQLLKDLETERGHVQTRLNEFQALLENIRIERQSLLLMQNSFKEQIEERQCSLDELLPQLSEDADPKLWSDQVAQVTQKIERLGPINLAAIDEFKTVNERKEYLDQQQKDLLEALDLLRNAIQKIDKETRTKFKDTFDKANEHFQSLFPRIFGGGKAYLELEESDLLTAGVVVKAQPPGKRNSTVHMLSGGEKALVAISLVFSMFQLNPAPFCVLDEVDAPLDDVNVGRYCQLIKEMSGNTQFIIISHNKVTIGIADHLLGVTMQEPGVSRVVAVDMREAIEMVD